MEGTALIRFKTAFIPLLNSALNTAGLTYAAAYGTPNIAQNILGTDGTGVVAWFDVKADAGHTVKVLVGEPCWIDELAHPTLVVQAIGLTTDDTQVVVDARANTVLGYAIAVLLKDPHVGLTDDTIETFTVLPASWTYSGTNLSGGSSQVAARFDLRLEVEARLKLTL